MSASVVNHGTAATDDGGAHAFASLLVSGALESRMAALGRTAHEIEAVIGLACGDDSRIVSIDASGVSARRGGGLAAPRVSARRGGGIADSPVSAVCGPRPLAQRPWPLGCITKLLTAALALDAVSRGELMLDAPVTVAGFGAARERLTLRDLLDHTHGLADPPCAHAPRTARGLLDVEALRGGAAPVDDRRAYSYSDIGPWLAAAALERATRKPQAFEAALWRRVLIPARAHLADGAVAVSTASICPARGAAARLSVEGLLSVLKWMMAYDHRPACVAARARMTALPGWHPIERGVACGFKVYDDGWLGHQSVVPGASLLVRVRPTTRSAVVVATATHHAGVLAARLLGAALPAFASFSRPEQAVPSPADGHDAVRSCGRYVRGRSALVITPSAAGSGLELHDSGMRVALRPAGPSVLLADPPGRTAFVQPIRRRGDDYAALWDGQRVLVNAAHPGRSRSSPLRCPRAAPRPAR